MAKFKKGDRVRALMDTAWVDKGWKGVVAENNSKDPWVEWDNGKLFAIDQNKIELITKTNNMDKVKIAVSFENDSEKLAYLEYCESIGKHTASGGSPIFLAEECDSDSLIDFDKGMGHSPFSYYKKEGYTILPFKVFAALKGIEYKTEVTVKLNDQYTATILNDKVVVGCQEFQFSVIEDLYHEVKKRIDNV